MYEYLSKGGLNNFQNETIEKKAYEVVRVIQFEAGQTKKSFFFDEKGRFFIRPLSPIQNHSVPENHMALKNDEE